jgi:hypothetical protein
LGEGAGRLRQCCQSSLDRKSGLSYKSSLDRKSGLSYKSSLERKGVLSRKMRRGHKSGRGYQNSLGQRSLGDSLDLILLESRLPSIRGTAVLIPVPSFDRLSQI